jgi:hypothetical protein
MTTDLIKRLTEAGEAIPKGWRLRHLGQEKHDGLWLAQIECDIDHGYDDNAITFVSRTGLTAGEAFAEALKALEAKDE